MLKRVWDGARQMLAGIRLTRAIEKNQKAADELDNLLREVLRR